MCKIVTCILLLWGLWGRSLGQNEKTFFLVEEIVLQGNKKTKDFIILREVGLRRGDTVEVSQSEEVCQKIRDRIFNLNLFIDVEVSFESTNDMHRVLFIRLKERFFVFFAPIFEIGDRNFNEWFYDRSKDLSRLNYGIIFTKRNLRGRNETLEATFQGGFLQKYKLAYKIPYIDKSQNYGLQLYWSYTQFKNLAYQTQNNKLLFLRSIENLRERVTVNFKLRKRTGFYQWQNIELHFTHNWINDTILQLNNNFHLNRSNKQKFFHINYEYLWDTRDFASYPLEGEKVLLRASKYGLFPSDDINLWIFQGDFRHYQQWNKHFYSAIALQGRIFLHKGQPYSNAQALGYGNDLVRAYQLYVIDGQHYALLKTDFKYKMIDFKKSFEFLPSQVSTIPVSILPKLFFDVGFVWDNVFYNESNFLANQVLLGIGVGIDVISFYNSVLQLDFGYNRQRQWGIFLNFESSF